MNLFTGMTNDQIISIGLAFVLFNTYNLGVIASLVGFYLSSKPIRGRTPSASMWFLFGLFWFMWCEISLVWAAPAENAFINANVLGSHFFDPGYARFFCILVGLVFFVLGAVSFLVGFLMSRSQRARMDAETGSSAMSSSGQSITSATPA